jgi:hypothetical protein
MNVMIPKSSKETSDNKKKQYAIFYPISSTITNTM